MKGVFHSILSFKDVFHSILSFNGVFHSILSFKGVFLNETSAHEHIAAKWRKAAAEATLKRKQEQARR